MKIVYAALVLFSIVTTSFAQDITTTEEADASIGFGFGLDYGGTGVRFTVPVKTNLVKLVAGVGVVGFLINTGDGFSFAPDDFGFNGGVVIQPISKGLIRPNIVALYGYNGKLKNTGNHPRFDRTYYGPSIGASVEIHSPSFNGNFINVGAMMAIHSKSYQDAVDGAGDDFKKPSPVFISIGYHLVLGY
jgi:hypothetical protein